MYSIENSVLVNLLASKENCKLFADHELTQSYFLFPESKKFFEILWYHYKLRDDTMKRDSFASYLRRSSIMTEDYKAKLTLFYEEISQIPPVSDFSVLLEEFVIYYKTSYIGNVMTKATSVLHDKNPEKAMEILKSDLQKLQMETTKKDIESGFFGRTNLLELYDQRRDHPEMFRGIELGFPSMDAILTHKPGTVTLIIGQMKSAKSVLMVNIARNMITRGKKVYYHVNEGGSELVQNRLVSCDSGLHMTKIERSGLNPAEYDIYKSCLNKYQNTDLLFIDSVPNSVSNAGYIEKTLLQLEEKLVKFDVILVDYLGLMGTTQKVDSDWQKIGVVALELKDIAMKFKIPIIVIGHVNRKGMEEDKKYFDMDEMGLSIEPLKHVDVVASWRIHDTDIFEITNTGQGTLSVRGSRQSGQKSVVLDVDTNIMKIWENVKTINIVTSSAESSGSSTF